MSNPFATSPFAPAAPAAPVAPAPVAPINVAPVAEAAPAVEGEVVKKARKPRVSTNRRKTSDEVKYILANYKDQSTSEIARHLKLTPQQVSRTILDARKSYNQKAESLPPEKAAQVRAWIEMYLPSKASEFGKGGGKRGNMVDNLFDDIFGELL